jgi:hypothetical protein
MLRLSILGRRFEVFLKRIDESILEKIPGIRSLVLAPAGGRRTSGIEGRLDLKEKETIPLDLDLIANFILQPKVQTRV